MVILNTLFNTNNRFSGLPAGLRYLLCMPYPLSPVSYVVYVSAVSVDSRVCRTQSQQWPPTNGRVSMSPCPRHRQGANETRPIPPSRRRTIHGSGDKSAAGSHLPLHAESGAGWGGGGQSL